MSVHPQRRSDNSVVITTFVYSETDAQISIPLEEEEQGAGRFSLLDFIERCIKH